MKKSSSQNKVNSELINLVKSYVRLLDGVNPPDSRAIDEIRGHITSSGLRSFKSFYEEAVVKTLSKGLGEVFMGKMLEGGMSLEKFSDELRKTLGGELVLLVLFLFLDMVSQLTYRKSMKSLYEEARQGNDESLFRLLRLDKTLFDHEWLRERMLLEMFMADFDFFKKLGNAIKGEPPIAKLRQGKLKLVLFLFWPSGLSKLTIPELWDFLTRCGFEMNPDVEVLRKFVDREIKPLFKPS